MTRIKLTPVIFLMALLSATNAMGSVWESIMMPGKLIEGHEKYEPTCEKCHENFNRKKQSRLCRQCHEKIEGDIKAKSGYHGRVQNINNIECNACHTDHKGRNVDIVKMDKQTFDHRQTDFALKGKHSSIACQACHISHKPYREAPGKCYDCHKDSDIHKGRLGKKCQTCHSEKNWLHAKFDHDKTKFKLTDKHKETSCNGCHINQNYKDTPVDCVRCHITKDIHEGGFGVKCNSCHLPEKWDKITFDHDKKTKFKRLGKHRTVECAACHTKNPYKKKTSDKCISCHKNDDVHHAIFGEKCHSCHTEKGWQIMLFKHNRDTKFTLDHKHATARCQSCHQKNPYNVKSIRDCYACHRADDVHKGGQGKKCNTCHSNKNWSGNVSFDHDLSDFPLIGLHATVTCAECHQDNQYKKTSSKCFSCHKEADKHKGAFGNKCQDCHNPNAWTRWKFDHDSQTKHKLEESHKNLECHACHFLENGKEKPPVFCNGCHARDDIHNGSFGIQCDQCHAQDSFNNIRMLN